MSSLESAAKPLSGFVLGFGAIIAFGALATSVWIAPRPANATPAYASQTGLACGRCHVNPAGGGPRTAFGKAFAANGHKLPAKGRKGKSSSAAPGATMTTVTTAAPVAVSPRSYVPDVTGSPRAADYVPGTNPGVVFYGPSPGPVLYGETGGRRNARPW